VTSGKPIAVWLQSISGVSAVNPLVAFYDIQEKGRCAILFFYPGHHTRLDRHCIKHLCHPPTNPHWARVVGFGPFSLCVIHREGLCPSSRDIDRLMMMMMTMKALKKTINIHLLFLWGWFKISVNTEYCIRLKPKCVRTWTYNPSDSRLTWRQYRFQLGHTNGCKVRHQLTTNNTDAVNRSFTTYIFTSYLYRLYLWLIMLLSYKHYE
jgi:hypothetical protein